MRTKTMHSFREGLQDAIPIALGYLSVSFTFGIAAVAMGMEPWIAIAISMTNLTSAGQFAGITSMAAAASYLEVALSQLVINLRYALMSVSLSQKLGKSVKTPGRLAISFGITDEIFAVSSTKEGAVGKSYMAGLISLSYIGWALGTALGAISGSLLPLSVQSALGIAIYGMFIAIVVPSAKKSLPVFCVLALSVLLSCAFRFVPFLSQVSEGFVIIICAMGAAAFGAWKFPQKEGEQ